MPVMPFQLVTLVRLVTPEGPPPPTAGDAAIQAAHIRYLTELFDQGLIIANGPVKRLSDPLLRGLTMYRVPPDEARMLAEGDPAVQAGWFDLVIDQWMIPARPATIGDRHDMEIDVPV